MHVLLSVALVEEGSMGTSEKRSTPPGARKWAIVLTRPTDFQSRRRTH